MPLLLSCARPAMHEVAPCTITVPAGTPLQAVLDAAPSGAVICLPAGTWTANVRVTKPLTLRGAGPDKTFLRSAELAQPVLTIGPLVEPAGPVVLIGLQLTAATGSCSDLGGCAHGLLVSGTATVEAEKCTFSQNAGTGIAVRDQATATVRNSAVLANTGYGVVVTGQATVRLVATTVSANRSTGIWVADSARLELSQSTVTQCEAHGLWIRDRSTFTATASLISSCMGHGIWVRDAASVGLHGCTITAHRDSGIWAEHDAEVLLDACVVEQTWDGVVARNSSRVTIENCSISRVRWDGIKLQGSATASIVGSALIGGRGSGIHIGGAAQAEIRGNRVESWVAHGILGLSRLQATGQDNRFANNGVDLSGNLPGSLRSPLRPPDQGTVRFPSPSYTTVQEAVDAVSPGGLLILAEGIYPGGITLGKELRIETSGTVLLTAPSRGESPVLSLVDGADLSMSGVALGYGSEGLTLGASSQAALIDCVISDNVHGIHATGTARVALVRCSLSRNQQGGIWLWDSAHGDIRDTSLTANGLCGIGAGGSSIASVVRCRITESGWTAGVAVRDSAQAHLIENTIVANYGVGVALFHELCAGARYVFTGRVTGGHNVIEDNYKGPVCPGELSFLMDEGGELDFRR